MKMTHLTYLQNRTIYYSLFVSALLERNPIDIYKIISPMFFTDNDDVVKNLLESPELNKLHSCNVIELYQNYISSFCTDKDLFGRCGYEKEAIQLKLHILNIIEELIKIPTANALSALCENYDKSLTVVYALTLYCSNPRVKGIYLSALKKATRDADGLDACLALLYLDAGKKEWLEILNRNITMQFYPEVRDIIEHKYQINP